jgi:death on curing protein
VNKPVWIEERDVTAIHARLLAIEGAAAGIRDRGLLQSALARARHLFAYDQQAAIPEMAAAYASGIVHDHPFLDGNKRTGFVVCILFLEMNGYRFRASEEAATQAVLGLASRTLSESAFVAWLRANVKRA